jgi:membrane protein implicated in regulation of membrane protease activity
MDFFSNHALVWFIAGTVLLILEFVVPGVFILFFGLGAWITSLCVYLLHPAIGIQFLIFSITSVLSLIWLRTMLLNKLQNTKNNADPDEEFVGKLGSCIETIEPGKDGKVEFKGTSWKATSNFTIHSNTKVKIINKSGLTLIVEPA